MKNIRIGIVGAGTNTRDRHIPGLQAIEGVEIVSVCNRRRASAEQVAECFGIAKVYDDWQALVAADDVDAIVIGTWPYMHCPVAIAALEAGKHVMTEARMAMNATEAEQMLAASLARPELVAQVVPSPFTLGIDKTIQRLIRSGELGAVLALDVRFSLPTFLDREAPLSWRQDATLSGNNVLTLGIWYEAVMRWLGEAEQVLASGKVFGTPRFDPVTETTRDVEIPEHLVINAAMACGAQATFFHSTITGGLALNETHLFGEKATLKLTGGFDGGKLWMATPKQPEFREVAIPADERGGWRVEAEFIAAIRGEEPITHTRFEDGVRYMRFTDAVKRSLASGASEAV